MDCECTPNLLSIKMSAPSPQHSNNTLTGNGLDPLQSHTLSSFNNITDINSIASNKARHT